MISSRNIVDTFLKMEQENNLFFLKDKFGLYFWDYVRYDIFYHLLEEKEIFKKNKGIVDSNSLIRKVLRAIALLYNELVFLVLSRQKEILFFNVSRNVNKKGFHYDHVLMDAMEVTGNYYCLESFYNAKFPLKERLFRKYYTHFKNRISTKKILKSKDQFEQISTLLNQAFDTNIDWAEHIAKKLIEFENQKRFYRKVLDRVKPKIIFLARNGNLQSLVSEAHKRGVKVYEMQHGSITPASLFYNYPKGIDLSHIDTLPDALLTFGSYWNDKVSESLKTITLGNNRVANFGQSKNIQNRGVTVISGKYVFKTLVTFTCKLAEHTPEITYYFKLHPGERIHIDEAKKITKQQNNIQIIYDEESVEELFGKSEAVLLIQSTSAYIALHQGLKAIVYKDLYYEESSDIFNIDTVFLVDNEHEAIKALNSNKDAVSTLPKFFTPFQDGVFKKILQLETSK